MSGLDQLKTNRKTRDKRNLHRDKRKIFFFGISLGCSLVFVPRRILDYNVITIYIGGRSYQRSTGHNVRARGNIYMPV